MINVITAFASQYSLLSCDSLYFKSECKNIFFCIHGSMCVRFEAGRRNWFVCQSYIYTVCIPVLAWNKHTVSWEKVLSQKWLKGMLKMFWNIICGRSTALFSVSIHRPDDCSQPRLTFNKRGNNSSSTYLSVKKKKVTLTETGKAIKKCSRSGLAEKHKQMNFHVRLIRVLYVVCIHADFQFLAF